MPPFTEEQKTARGLKRKQTAALRAEADAHRREATMREWQERGLLLTYAELLAGEPCRGCGNAIIDDLGDRPPLVKMTDEERLEYQRLDEAFARVHVDCHEARWSMAGSQAIHCCNCCPPPPMSPRQIEGISAILRSALPAKSSEQDTWQLLLTCEHVIEKTQHYTNRDWTSRTATCGECRTTRGIVTATRISDAESRIREAAAKRSAELQRARNDVARLEEAAQAAREELRALEEAP
ncbi:hypothetical protein [Agromyces bauzanensis]